MNLTTGSIVIKTHNKIMFPNLPKNIEIQIWPVTTIKLSDTEFTVSTSFGIDTTSIIPRLIKNHHIIILLMRLNYHVS